MFYNKKYLFFIIAYLMSFVLCFFIYKQFPFAIIDVNLTLFSLIVYTSILIFSFGIAMVLLYLFKFFKHTFKVKNNNIATNFLWDVFTGIVYLSMSIIFIKVTQY
jgi:hypothetical protein